MGIPTEPPGGADHGFQRFNFALAAAWVLVAAFLAAGLWWLVGSFPMPQTYYDPSGNEITETSSRMAMSLYRMGSFLLLLGSVCALTLLLVQASRFRPAGRQGVTAPQVAEVRQRSSMLSEMGNTHTPGGADHDIYRRPVEGMEPQHSVQQPSVQIVEDGSGADAVARPDAVAIRDGAGDETTPRHTEPAGSPLAAVPFWRRFNLALAVAWALVGLLLAAGLSWFTGILPPSQMLYDPTGNPISPPTSVMVMNLQSMGPLPFILGLMGAFTLVAVQAARFGRNTAS